MIENDVIHGIYDIPVRIYTPRGRLGGFCIAVDSADAHSFFNEGCEVIEFDFPGHGDSKAEEYFCEANCRLDLKAVLEYARCRHNDKGRRGITASGYGAKVLLEVLEEWKDSW